MDVKFLALIGGLIGYLVGLYIIGTIDPVGLVGTVLVTAGLIIIAITAPSLGYLIRVLAGKAGFPTMKEHMIFMALGFYLATGAMLMIYLEYQGWRPFILITSLIIAVVPAFIFGKR